MISTPRLTKKQKKGIAYREGKGNRKTAKEDDEKSKDFDIEVDAEMENGSVLPDKKRKDEAPPAKKDKGKGKALENEVAPRTKKRKRDPEQVDKVEESEEIDEDAPKKKKKTNDEKQRFILFLGNLKYTTSLHSIEEHFSACDPPPSVRLLTPKTSTPSNKSKGCAFLEFTHRNALQQALKLHQSQLDGRAINVELTAGGGGKSNTRLKKVQERNKKLHEERKERQEKNGETTSRPQRFSATSGLGAAPVTRKTWTVGDADDGAVHRGGKKHSRKVRPGRSQEWGTGVNAIPVG